MENKAVSGIMLTLLLIGMLTWAFSIQPAESEPATWTVDDDGPADFSTIQDAIDAANPGDLIYVEAGTYYEHVIVNKAVSLIGEDGENAIVDGSVSGTVIQITADYVTIFNLTVQNSGFTLSEHTGPMYKGVVLNEVNNVAISNCNLKRNQIGIHVALSSECSLTQNEFADNIWGVILEHSRNILLQNNILTDNSRNFLVWGEGHLERYIHDIDTSNTINGKPIYYWINERNRQVPHDAGYVGLINCTQITARDLDLSNNHRPFILIFTNDSLIQNVTAKTLDGALIIIESNNNIIKECTFQDIGWKGIRGGWAHIAHSHQNAIYHNNFINDTMARHKVDLWSSSDNYWDNGAGEGNYWSDYTGEDLNGDGIGDTLLPHNWVDNYPLLYPWGASPTVAATADVVPNTLNLRSKGEWITAYVELPEGYDVGNIDVSTVMLNETIPVSLLDVPASEPVPTETGDYDNDGVPDLMVKFNRTELTAHIYHDLGIRYGNVTLTVSGQLADGTVFEGGDVVMVIFGGDVNNDKFVNVFDLLEVRDVLGTADGDFGYNPGADLNLDGFINLHDLLVARLNLGATVP